MNEYAVRKVSDNRYIIMQRTGRYYIDVATALSLYMAEKIIDGLNK